MSEAKNDSGAEIFAEDFEPCCKGEVMRVRDYKQYTLNGYPAGQKIITSEYFRCAECARVLTSPAIKASD